MIKALKKQQKTPFPKTKFGKCYYSTLKTITSPFAKIHYNAGKNLVNSDELQLDKDLHEAENLILKANYNLNDFNEEEVAELVNNMAKVVMTLEDNPVQIEDKQYVINELREKIEELRQETTLTFKDESVKLINDLIKQHSQITSTR